MMELTTPVTLDVLFRIFRICPMKFQEAMVVQPVSVSIPTDGKGVRVKIKTIPGNGHLVPNPLHFTFNDTTYEIPVEVTEDHPVYSIRVAPREA